MKGLNEFLKELKYNQNINFKKGLSNRVNIDYVIERLENIKKEIKKEHNQAFETLGKYDKKLKQIYDIVND